MKPLHTGGAVLIQQLGTSDGSRPGRETGPLRPEQALARLRSSEGNDTQLRSAVIESQLPLAINLAKQFQRRGEQWPDLVQVASLALVKAVDRFDPDVGASFSTYATATIVGELKRHLRDHVWGIRPRRSIQELYLRQNSVVSDLTNERSRSPTIAEVAERLGASEHDVLEALEAGRNYYPMSLEDRLGASFDGDSRLGDRLGEIDPGYGEIETRDALEKGIAKLPQLEREIVLLRFYNGMTQWEIAQKVGVSQMHVSRLLARGLDHLRGLSLNWT